MANRKIVPIAIAVGFLAACSESPTNPHQARLPQSGVAGLEIQGPQVLGRGETSAFTVFALLSNGSRRDVTAEASWYERSGFPAFWYESSGVVSFAQPGLAKGLKAGETHINVEFGGRITTKQVMVLAAGTYRLTGLVKEAGIALASGIAGGRIEIISGVGAGTTTVSYVTGDYRLYGLSGETMVRVTKDGYEPAELTLVVANHQAHDLRLPLGEPNPDMSGTYTLTLAAAESCGVGLGQGNIPQAYRVLTYPATVHQSGSTLQVWLSGAIFLNASGRFAGRIERERIVFSMPWYDGEPPPVTSAARRRDVSGCVGRCRDARFRGSPRRLALGIDRNVSGGDALGGAERALCLDKSSIRIVALSGATVSKAIERYLRPRETSVDEEFRRGELGGPCVS